MQSPRMRTRVLVLTLIVVSMLGSLQTISAQDNSTPVDAFVAPKFSIQPASASETPWLQTELNPGGSGQLEVLITNFGTVDVELRTYIGDAYSMVNGGFSVYGESTPRTGISTWVTYEPTTFSLGPGESRAQTMSVDVPENTTPGQYVAGVVVQTASPLEIPGSTTFSQVIRSSMAVVISVPGDLSGRFALGQPVFVANESVRTLRVPITNTGNVLVKPAGTLVITDADGAIVMEADVAMGSVYSGTETFVQVEVPAQVPLGNYTVALNLADEATGSSASVESSAELSLQVASTEPAFSVSEVSVTANAESIQYANVTAVIDNPAQAIPTASILLVVTRDGEEIEQYPLATNSAISNGETAFEARYIPEEGWLPGTYVFTFVVIAVNDSDASETILASVEAPETIQVPE